MRAVRMFSGWAVILSCFLVVATTPRSATSQTTERVPIEQTSTEQKAKFVGNLVTRSVSAKTIEQSDDDAAKLDLERARALVEKAKADLLRGQAATANEKLDEALHLVNAQSRRLSQARVKGERQQEEYERRRHAVRTFLAAYERVAKGKDLSANATAQMARIRDLLGAAAELEQDRRLDEANDTLERAYRMARGDIREMRDGKTLTRTLSFATPRDKYDYEHDRNDSHIMLLQFAIKEKSPPPARLKRIDQLRDEALAIRHEAEAKARSGEHPAAIDALVRSTDTLLKAIRMSGIWVPG